MHQGRGGTGFMWVGCEEGGGGGGGVVGGGGGEERVQGALPCGGEGAQGSVVDCT